MKQTSEMSACDWVCWLVGLVAGVLAFWASVDAVTWIPALLVAIAVGAFVALVLGNLICGAGETATAHGSEADHGGSAGSEPAAAQGSALVEEALAEAEGGARDSGAAGAGISAEEAAAEQARRDKAMADEAAAKARAEAEAAEKKAAQEAAAQAKAEADAKAAASAAATPDYDADGVHEGENEGTRPATLSAPREGGADNLKEIKGVGPKLEKMLNEMGFYHFDQIAAWTDDEVAWVNANLKGFKGRVTRDNWVEQARILAAGGETEFSKRVDKGEVY